MRRPLPSLAASLLLPLVAAICLNALPVTAQDTSAAQGYPVRGVVLNNATGQPVARALVVLNQDFAMLTGSDGTFSFDGVPSGQYMTTVSKPGFVGLGRPAGRIMSFAGRGTFITQSGPPRRIQVGPDMPSLTLRISPEAMIVGQVTLSTADPADGIQIMVFRRQFQNGRARWTQAAMSTTRSDGSFRVPDLAPGRYMLYAQASLDRPGLAAANSNIPVWGYPAVYYPGVTDFSAAGVLTLGSGQQAEADLTLSRQQFFPVTAVVHGAPDSPLNFQVIDSGGRPIGLSPRYDRRDEMVHLNLPSGSWSLVARGMGRAMSWGRTDFQVAGAPTSIAVSVLPISRVPVTIHRDFTATQAAGSDIQSSGPGVNLTLEPVEDFSQNGLGNLRTADGSTDGTSYELDSVQPGRFWVQTDSYSTSYVSSITSGGVDLAANPLTFAAGTSPAPIEITLRNDAGTITGGITNQTVTSSGATPTPGDQPQSWIFAIPLFPTTSSIPHGFLQSNGQFTITGLAPGSYRVVACDTPQEIDFHSTEGLAAWAGKGQTVTVDAGGTAHVDLDVIHVELAP